MSDKGGEFLVGFVIGAVAGAAAALILAPCSGDDMRRQIEERGIELKRQAQNLADEAREQAARLTEEARSQAGELQERGRIVLTEKVKQAQHAIQDAQTKLAADDAAIPEA